MNFFQKLQYFFTKSRISTHFSGPYRRQNWSLPDSIIYYMAKNPSNPKVYQKLIQSCKYFFIKNSIIVLSCLHYTKDGWKTCAFTKCSRKLNEMYKINLEKISNSNLWILDTFDLCLDTELTPPSIISKIYKCQVNACHFLQQSMTVNELLFMAFSAENCVLWGCIVRDNDTGIPLQLEEIIAILPKVQYFGATLKSNAPNISSKTVKEFLKLPHFSNIKKLAIFNFPESLDFDTLFNYFKDTNDMLLNLHFCDSISDAFKNRLDALVNEILATPSLPYRTPLLAYHGQDEQKHKNLHKRFMKDNSNNKKQNSFCFLFLCLIFFIVTYVLFF